MGKERKMERSGVGEMERETVYILILSTPFEGGDGKKEERVRKNKRENEKGRGD